MFLTFGRRSAALQRALSTVRSAIRGKGARMNAKRALSVTVLALAAATACTSKNDVHATNASAKITGGLPQGAEVVKIDPADFSTNIDNPWWPMKPGTVWTYRETDSSGNAQDLTVTVTDQTKRPANGVEVRVVHDAVTKNGEPVEITDDYYAQDSRGNIWYMGEDTAEYEGGKVTSREGSFEAGKHGAQGGVAIPAHPVAGLEYRQEYWKDHAEDRGKVIVVGEQAEVPAGHYPHSLMTRDTNPLEPKNVEFKFYARNIGPVLSVGVSGTTDREELTAFKPAK
jgi:hypothetical protein